MSREKPITSPKAKSTNAMALDFQGSSLKTRHARLVGRQRRFELYGFKQVDSNYRQQLDAQLLEAFQEKVLDPPLILSMLKEGACPELAALLAVYTFKDRDLPGLEKIIDSISHFVENPVDFLSEAFFLGTALMVKGESLTLDFKDKAHMEQQWIETFEYLLNNFKKINVKHQTRIFNWIFAGNDFILSASFFRLEDKNSAGILFHMVSLIGTETQPNPVGSVTIPKRNNTLSARLTTYLKLANLILNYVKNNFLVENFQNPFWKDKCRLLCSALVHWALYVWKNSDPSFSEGVKLFNGLREIILANASFFLDNIVQVKSELLKSSPLFSWLENNFFWESNGLNTQDNFFDLLKHIFNAIFISNDDVSLLEKNSSMVLAGGVRFFDYVFKHHTSLNEGIGATAIWAWIIKNFPLTTLVDKDFFKRTNQFFSPSGSQSLLCLLHYLDALEFYQQIQALLAHFEKFPPPDWRPVESGELKIETRETTKLRGIPEKVFICGNLQDQLALNKFNATGAIRMKDKFYGLYVIKKLLTQIKDTLPHSDALDNGRAYLLALHFDMYVRSMDFARHSFAECKGKDADLEKLYQDFLDHSLWQRLYSERAMFSVLMPLHKLKHLPKQPEYKELKLADLSCNAENLPAPQNTGCSLAQFYQHEICDSKVMGTVFWLAGVRKARPRVGLEGPDYAKMVDEKEIASVEKILETVGKRWNQKENISIIYGAQFIIILNSSEALPIKTFAHWIAVILLICEKSIEEAHVELALSIIDNLFKERLDKSITIDTIIKIAEKLHAADKAVGAKP